MADTAFRDQLYDFAGRQYAAFLEKFPASDRTAEVRRLLAQCQLGQGDWEAALTTLRAGEAGLAADDLESRFWAAEALAYGGDFAAAEEHYLAVRDQGGGSDLAGSAGAGLAYVRFKQGRYEEAAATLDALDPGNLPDKLRRRAALLRCQILLAREQFGEANRILQEFLDRHA